MLVAVHPDGERVVEAIAIRVEVVSLSAVPDDREAPIS
jgi:hypothetical protein